MILKLVYFKLRGRFNFSPHPYEIGRPIIQNNAFADNYFCLKLYELNASEYDEFYTYQLNHFLKNNPPGEVLSSS